MPSKSRRAASRQARLNQRKRRTKGKDRQDTPLAAPPSPMTARAETPRATTEAPAPTPRASPTMTQAPEAPAPVRRRRARRATAGPDPAYKYLGSELKRIGVLITLLVAVLVVLSFVLR
jgi:hypothetical protein